MVQIKNFKAMILEKDQQYLIIEYKHNQLMEQYKRNITDLSKNTSMLDTPNSYRNHIFMVILYD